MNLKTILTEFVRHRQLVTVRRSQHELREARTRAHILEGLLKAIDILDDVIETIKKSKNAEVAKINLMKKFSFTDPQAVAILDMQLKKLAALERQKLTDEYQLLKETINYLVDLLTHPSKVLDIIVEDLQYLKKTYGDQRLTRVVKGKIGELAEIDLIPQRNTIVTVTETGYIKRMPVGTYRAQRRGGKGVKGMVTKAEDVINTIFTASTHDDILFFTNRGKVYKLKVHQLPEGSRASKGQAIINLLQVEQGELVQSTLVIPRKDGLDEGYILTATKQGRVKKTPLKEYENIKSNGLIAIDLRDKDELIKVTITTGDSHVILATKQGKSIRFAESDIRPTGRDTQGVKGISMTKSDELIAMITFPKKQPQLSDKRRKIFRDLLVITEKGLGKRTPLIEYPLQRRGGQGVKVAKLGKKTGQAAAIMMVTQEDEFIVITTTQAQVIKLPLKNIPSLKRPTQGVILLRLSTQKDSVAAATPIKKN
jgi:DNA gyrase subunit A